MQLVSVEFAVFFLAVLAVCRAVWDNARHRKVCLLGASYVFYASMHAGFAVLLFAVSLCTFGAARALATLERPLARRATLWLYLALTLGELCLFKYWGLLYDLAGPLLGMADQSLALPVGISFFTFQAVGYVIDAYRDKTKGNNSLLDVLTFVAFFPTVLSGPILRGADFIGQINAKRPAWTDETQALWLIALGLFKKITLSSYLSEHVTRHLMSAPESFSALGALAGAVVYSAQIYLDFSGYSDLAQGLAGLLGLRVPDNFKSPYKALNLRQFWQGWHISLSTWLRDYLYIPLGGNRLGPSRTAANLLVTMGLGGLWHGAGLNFLVWGLLHGLGLCALHLWGARGQAAPRGLARAAASWTATFGFVTLAWVFFAAPDTATALGVLGRILSADPTGQPPQATACLIAAVVIGAQALRLDFLVRRPDLLARLPAPVMGAAMGTLGALAVRLGPDGVLPFIYFSF